MNEEIQWERLTADTQRGDAIKVSHIYSSMNKTEIDELQKSLQQNIGFYTRIANAKPTTWLIDGLTKEEVQETVDNALVKANNAKWQKAIEAIKEEIKAKCVGYDRGHTIQETDIEDILNTIDKHTKELMK